jgi:hypothetical protein
MSPEPPLNFNSARDNPMMTRRVVMLCARSRPVGLLQQSFVEPRAREPITVRVQMGTSHRAGEVRGADYQDLRRKSLLKSTSDNGAYRTLGGTMAD